MKKSNKKAFILALSMSIFLVGCAGKNELTTSTDTKSELTDSEKTNEKEEKETTENNNKETTENNNKENDDSFANPANIGKTIENDGMDYTIKKAGVLENEFTTGPFKIKITGVSAGVMTPKTDETKSYLKDKEEAPAIIIYATVENTEDKKANLFLSQSPITTSTQEQLEPDFFLSLGNGEFLGAVKEDMSMTYLPETNVDELTEIKLHVSAPSDENFTSIGDELQITITFNDKGEVESIK